MPFRRLLLGLLTSLGLAIAGLSQPLIPGTVTGAQAQVSAEFQEALEPYGHWERHARWGEIWVPDGLPPDWRPYEYGHWVYTDDWGWYWISDPEEEDWGWVVFHYGRWAFDSGLGWFWIPDDEWAPAWVDWRYGGDYVGWAPLPPDDEIVEYDDNPAYWMFVSPRYLTHPSWRSYMVPRSRGAAAFRRTQVVNRSVGYGRGRAAVNPGISPAFVARASRAAVPTYRVSPRVLAGTQGVSGAVRVTPQQLQAGRGGQRGRRPSASGANAVAVQRTSAVALPVGPATPAPQPLGKGQRGNLGTHPPRAAQGAPPQQQLPAQQQAPQRAAPPSPPGQPPAPAAQPPVQRHEPPPGAPPAPVERRERPPEPQRTPPAAAAPPAAAPPRPVAPQTPPPAAVHRPEPPHPPPPAAARPEPPHAPPPAAAPHPPPPAAARPAPPPHPAPPPAAKPAPKPAPKPEEKKDEPPK